MGATAVCLPPGLSGRRPHCSAAQATMTRTIKQYRIPADADGVLQIPMPEYCRVLGISQQGRGVVVVSDAHDLTERYSPRDFLIVRDGEHVGDGGYNYLGDLHREHQGDFYTQYVFVKI